MSKLPSRSKFNKLYKSINFKKMSPKGRFLLITIGIICLFSVVLWGLSNSAFIKRIIAEQSCPLVISQDGKVHGVQSINPNSSDSVFDCSTLDIIVASDGEVTVNSYKNADSSTSGDYGATLLVKNLTIEAGGKVTANGTGYTITDTDNPTGNGGTGTGESAGSGGANGGFGGEGVAADPNPAAPGGIAYGNAESPDMLGGSGGNGGTGGLGGAGGGAIKIIATENVEIYGSLTANGLDGVTDNTSSGGGGAGGSIWIESNVLAGNGLVQAIGGVSEFATYGGGGGGGGRIIMFCNALNTYTGSYSVAGGDPLSGQEGGVGSISGPTCRPSVPTVLKQFKMDQITQLAVGAPTAEGQFIIAGNLVDPDPTEQLTLQVEIRPLGTPFTNMLTHAQAIALSNPRNCTNNAVDCGKITISGLSRSVEYHWQARVKDNNGGFSNWVSFGENTEAERDILLSGLPVSVLIESGNSQTGVVFNTLTSSLAVKVVDSAGYGVPGATVTWAATNNKVGGALLDGASTQTDAEGIAINRYKLGQKTGINNVTATSRNSQNQHLTNSPLTFSLTGTPDVVNSFTASVPTYALTNADFDLSVTAYDQFSNIKTDYSGTITLSSVLASDIAQNGTGLLSVTSYTFLPENNGAKVITLSYNTKESIKIKIVDGLVTGYSNAIAIVDELGACPQPNGIIDVNATWTADLTNQGIFDCRGVPELLITAGATLTLVSYNSGDANYNNDFGVTILADNLTIDSGSFINSNGKGYPSSVGPGTPAAEKQGASHGGWNGENNKSPYGNVYEPIDLGSGGSSRYSALGGYGGGAIKLSVDNTLTVNGTITSVGNDSICAGGTQGCGGAGSGGSIYLQSLTFNGNGSILANGGTGNIPYFGGGGGGGGGRIAIYYSDGNFPISNVTNIQSRGGTNIGQYSSSSYNAGPGTVYVEQQGVDPYHAASLYVSNNGLNAKNAALISGTYRFNSINVKNYGHLEILGDGSLIEVSSSDSISGDSTRPIVTARGIFRYTGTGSFNINSYSIGIQGKIEGVNDLNVGTSSQGSFLLYANTWAYNKNTFPTFNEVHIGTNGIISLYPYENGNTNYTDDFSATLSAANLQIDNGGQLESNYKGYVAYRGPGSLASGAFGASHGGTGQASTARYGDVYLPSALGSGAGVRGGVGGGAVNLLLSESLINNGSITVRGQDGSSDGTSCGGGGSAGSIYIDVVDISGSGVISANGGNGCWGYNSSGSSGGGGRVAVYYETSSFPIENVANVQARSGGAVRMVHGSGAWAGPGGPGTVYIEQKNVDTANAGLLIIDNNSVNGLNAGVLEGTYQFKEIRATRYGHVEFLGQNGVLTLTSGAGLKGDSTKSRITINGTLNYTGVDTLLIEGVDLGLNGDMTGVHDVTLGNTIASGLTMYAYTWKRPTEASMIASPYSFGDLIVGQYGTMSLVPNNNGDSDYTNDWGVYVNAESINVISGGKIESNYRGYPVFKGPGSLGSGGYGAAHGGYSQTGAAVYGSVYEPNDLGSGGGNSTYGGVGGGAFKITISGILTNNGIISADGATGTTNGTDGGGGGSGGSIWLDTQTINGSGVISVNGGRGMRGYNTGGASGAGGRVALYYSGGDFPITNVANIQSRSGGVVQVIHGSGAAQNNGGPGTVYIENRTVDTASSGTLIVDNNNVNALTASVLEASYKFTKIQVSRYGHVNFLGQNSILEITSGSGMVGDSTKPIIIVSGTLNYTGSGTLTISGVDLGLNGDMTGVHDVTLGNTLASGLTMYARTWRRPTEESIIASPYSFGDLLIGQYGTMSLVPYDNGDSDYTNDWGVYIDAENINVVSGGKIESNYRGYPLFKGPGSLGSGGYGAAHGGYSQSGTSIYGSLYEPNDLGSGAGNALYGGVGGGAFKISLTGTLTNNGTISADGATGTTNGTDGGGGGSGGSIWIDTQTINGSGLISVNGGRGMRGYWVGGASGAGGRIALYYSEGDFPVSNVSNIQSRSGGVVQVIHGSGAVQNNGGPGTVYVENRSTDNVGAGTLLIDNNNVNGVSAGVSYLEGVVYQFKDILLTRYGSVKFVGQDSVLELPSNDTVIGDSTRPSLEVEGTIRYLAQDAFYIDGYTLIISGKMENIHDVNVGTSTMGGLTLRANTWYYNNNNFPTFGDLNIGLNGTVSLYSYTDTDVDYTEDYGCTLIADNLSVASGGTIESDYKGYAGNSGPGSLLNVFSGASHGGYNGEENKAPYGDIYEPILPGSGAGASSSAGGGAIKIIVNNVFTHDGIISTNGANGYYSPGVMVSYSYGAGSGGSILIDTATLNGSGVMRANGGNGVQLADNTGGAGAGGRIAIYYLDGDFPFDDITKLQSRGGTFPNVPTLNAGPGSVYVKNGGSLGDLTINNNGNAGQAENFTAIDYRLNSARILGGTAVNLLPDLDNNRGTRFILDSLFELDSTSSINGVGKGFPHAQGPGKGNDGIDVGGGGGGAHGGSGGEAEAAGGDIATGGIPYGDQVRPYTLGSGGGSSGPGTFGGEGGGSFAILSQSGQVDISGTINVSGTNGLATSPGGGGGAGGSILLLTQSCTVSGSLLAYGGNGGDGSVDGGGGGGGRISILNNGGTCGTTGTISVLEGTSVDGVAGGPGTYNGIIMLPQVDAAEQLKLNDEIIDVGGTTEEKSVKLKINVSNPAASIQDPKILQAQIEVAPINEEFTQVLGTSIVTTNTQNYAGGQPAEVYATVSGLVAGQSYKWQVRVLDQTDGINGEWIEYGSNGDSPDFIVTETTELRTSVTTTNVEVGDPVGFTITAYDIFGNVDTNYAGIVDFLVTPTPEIEPYLPLSYQFSPSDNGTKTFTGVDSVIFFVSGIYQIVTTDRNNSLLTVSSDEITVTGVLPTATPTPEPTVTNTPVPTLTDTPVPLTGTPIPTVTDNATPTPTILTITNTLTPTTSVAPTVLDITNVQIAQAETGEQICWKTNMLATGYVAYGIDPGAYTFSTLLETEAVINHCQLLTLEGDSTQYYYKIFAIGPNNEQANYPGAFEIIITSNPPETGSCHVDTPTVTGNITNGYRIAFTTDNNDQVICSMKSGEDVNNLESTGLTAQEEGNYFVSDILAINLPRADYIKYELLCENIGSKCSFVSKIDLNWPGNPITETLTDIAATSVAKVAAVGMVGLSAVTFAVANPQILWMGLLWFYRKSKKNRYGIVYDNVTKQAVPFAVVRLLDTITERVIVQTVSDLQGRYHLLGGEGQYILETTQDGYTTYRLPITLSGKDLQVTNNIGLSKNKSAPAKKFSLRTLARKLNNYIFVLGFVFSLLMLLLNFYIVNVIIILIYLFQIVIIILQRPPRYWGKVVEAGTGRAIKGAFISILDTVEQRQVDVQITDAQGRFGLLLEKQEYLLKANLTGYKPKSINKDWEKVVLPGGEITYLMPQGEVTDLDIEMEAM
jgi:hypothetical protein